MQSQDPPPCAIPDPNVTDPLLLGSYSRDHPLFLQLKDYFWVKTPSLYELPYGTKGSGKPDSAPWGVSVHPAAAPGVSTPLFLKTSTG